jgi:conjugal transfer/entry exclusion protein
MSCHRWRIGSVLLVLLLSLPLQARAQFAALVFDPTNWSANMAQVAQSILIVANQILDLTAIGEIVIAADDVGELAGIIEEASALKYDFVQLHNQVVVLFDLNTAPDTRTGLDARLQEMKSLMYDIRVYAIKTQSLVGTIQRTIAHMNSLVSRIEGFVGNLQSQQTIAQMETTVSKTLALIEVQQAAYQRSDTVDKLSEALVIESINRINQKRIADWPTW